MDEQRPGVIRFLPAILSAAVACLFAGLVPAVEAGGAPELVIPWVPAFGIDIAFRADGLGLTFALLVTGIGALVLLYTAEYFRNHKQRDRLLLLLVLFEISMLGLVLADDALTLFVFWEGTTVTSFLLIGFDHERAEARAKAIQALIVTGLGGVALLGGLLLLGAETGTFRLSEMAHHADALAESGFYVAIFVLVMLGCFTKSAQIPFHFWLPNAMAAPTPVSAYLHSATMVKAGVYLLARLSPTLGDTILWAVTLTVIGAATMVLSSIWSLRHDDLKLALAHTTVMGLGALTMMLGVGGEDAIVAACVFLLVHAFYKASLFLVIGVLDKKAGSRNASALGGLGRAMPITWLAALLAGGSMAGLAPFFGFLGKEAIYEGLLHGGPLGIIAIIAAVAANAMMLAIAGAVAISPFIGPLKSPKAAPGDGHWAMLLGPFALAALGLAAGLDPHLLDHALIGPMASSIAGEPVEVSLHLWHGITLPLLLSLATFALGFLLFFRLRVARAQLAALDEDGRAKKFETGYDAFLAGLSAAAREFSTRLQSGLLTRYLAASFAVLSVMVALAYVVAGLPTPAISTPPLLFVVIAALMAAATTVLPFTSRRLLMITSLGVVGSGVALVFAFFGAVDVAVTQLMVETLVVVIIAVALLKLPRISPTTASNATRMNRRNAVIATAFGVISGLLVLTALDGTLDLALTTYFEKHSATDALGRNIVNVILVDFRALDTMGEIAVVSIAALSALVLLAAKVRPLKDQR